MEASDNDIEVLSDTISSIKILSENENPQKDDDVFFRKIFIQMKNTQRRLPVNSMLITLQFADFSFFTRNSRK